MRTALPCLRSLAAFLALIVSVVAHGATDSAAPTVGAVTPAAITVNVATTFSASYSDNVGVAECDFFADQSFVGKMKLSKPNGPAGTASLSYSFTSTGNHVAQVRCRDGSRQEGAGPQTAIKVFLPDSTPPTVTYAYDFPTQALVNGSTHYLAAATDNSGSGAIVDCRFVADGADQGSMALQNLFYAGGVFATLDYTFTTLGNHSVQVKCIDFAGNVGAGDVRTVHVVSVIDLWPPVCGSLTPTTVTQGESTTFSATYLDDVGVVSATLYIDWVPVGDVVTLSDPGGKLGTATVSHTFPSAGYHFAYLACSDAAGHVGYGWLTFISVVDPTIPHVGTVTPARAVLGAATTFAADYTDSGKTAADTGIASCALFADYSQVGAMTLSAPGGTSGTASYTIGKDFLWPGSNHVGTHVVWVRCADVAGNTADSPWTWVYVAPNPALPTVSLVTPTLALLGQPTTFSASYKDDTGVAACSFLVDSQVVGAMTLSKAGGTSGTASIATTFSATGPHSARAACTDMDGNVSTGGLTWLQVNASGVSLVTPATVLIGEEATLSIQYQSAVVVDACTIQIGYLAAPNAMVLATPGATSGTASYALPADFRPTYGTFDFAAVACVDAAGHDEGRSTTQLWFTADPDGPAVGTVTPPRANLVADTTLTASYSDPDGVASCSLFVGQLYAGAFAKVGAMTLPDAGASAGNASITVPANFPWPAPPLKTMVSCRDALGHATDGPTSNLELDHPPTVRITAASDEHGTAIYDDDAGGSSATFTFAASDAEGPIAGTECSLDHAAFAPCTSPATYSGLLEGRHAFAVRAIDSAGQRGVAQIGVLGRPMGVSVPAGLLMTNLFGVDRRNGFAYFTPYVTSALCKVRLDDPTTLVDEFLTSDVRCTFLPGFASADSGFVDEANGYLYLGIGGGRVMKVRLDDATTAEDETAVVAVITIPAPWGWFVPSSVVFDPRNGYAYFGDSYAGQVAQVRVDDSSTADDEFAVVKVVDLARLAGQSWAYVTAGQIDMANGYAYFQGSQIYQLALDDRATAKNELGLVRSFDAPVDLRAGFIDSDSGFGYFKARGFDSQIVKVRLDDPATPENEFGPVAARYMDDLYPHALGPDEGRIHFFGMSAYELNDVQVDDPATADDEFAVAGTFGFVGFAINDPFHNGHVEFYVDRANHFAYFTPWNAIVRFPMYDTWLVDTTAPVTTSVTVSDADGDGTIEAIVLHGTDPAGSSGEASGLKEFRYSFDGGPVLVAKLDGGSATVPLSAPRTLLSTLSVSAVDKAGNVESARTFSLDAVVDHCPALAADAAHEGCLSADAVGVDLQTIDLATGASSTAPLVGVDARVFDRNDPEFQLYAGGKNPDGSVYGYLYHLDVGQVGTCRTLSDGTCLAGLAGAASDELVIIRFFDAATGKTVYVGAPQSATSFADTNQDAIPDLASAQLQITKVLDNGVFVEYRGGSKLTVE
jgi:hypothetical protein